MLRKIIKVKLYAGLPKVNVHLEAIQSQKSGFQIQVLLLNLIDQGLN